MTLDEAIDRARSASVEASQHLVFNGQETLDVASFLEKLRDITVAVDAGNDERFYMGCQAMY